jgi:hypothetical protein
MVFSYNLVARRNLIQDLSGSATELHGPLPDKSGVPVAVLRCGLSGEAAVFCSFFWPPTRARFWGEKGRRNDEKTLKKA